MIAEAFTAVDRIGWAIVAWICVGAAVATGLCVALTVGVWAAGRAGVSGWRALRKPVAAPLAPAQRLVDQSPAEPGERRTAPRWARTEPEQQQEAA